MPPKMEWQTMQTLVRLFLLEESDLGQQCMHGHMSENLKNNIKPLYQPFLKILIRQ